MHASRAADPLPLDVVVQPALGPGTSRATDIALLRELPSPGAERRGVLRVYGCPGRVLSLGRYHLAPGALEAGGVRLARRLSGGRVAACGAGFVGVSLVLPHRSALVADEPHALAPEQVMNRCVRGILRGLERAGVPAHYPGRDLLTAEGRTLGIVSFEVDAAGGCLFEAVIADDGDPGAVIALLEAADPRGVVPARMLGPNETTSIVRYRDRPLGHGAVAELLADGYAQAFGLRPRAAVLAADVEDVAEEARWVASRGPDPALDRRAATPGQLGVVEAHAVLAPDGSVARVLIAGDVIADSPAVGRLEAGLAGCAPERAAIGRVVEGAFASPRSFVLGITREAVVETIARAVGAR